MPKSQLFWMGTLMRLATGFWSFLASSAASSPAAGGSAPGATRETSGKRNGSRTSFVFMIELFAFRWVYFTVTTYLFHPGVATKTFGAIVLRPVCFGQPRTH